MPGIGQVISSWFGTFPGSNRFTRWVGPQVGFRETRSGYNKSFRYAVAGDSKRLLLSVPPAQAALPPLNVVVNWEAGLRK